MNAPPLIPGTVLAGRYQIGELLGEGGMARVYRARDLRLGRQVALKVLPGSASAELRARFSREARNAARLDHPGCVRIFESAVTDDGAQLLAMELLDGPTLRAELDAGALDSETATRVAAELLEALAHAHAAGLLHRDIKPENVMFRREAGGRRAVLIDFGLSELEGDAALTQAGSCVGSPSYLAPERILGTAYDGRADVYAIGVMLYEMVTGERPFLGDSPVDTARQHLERAIPSLPVGTPPKLVAACERAMQKRPDDRFASAAQMAASLAAASPVEAAGPTAAPTSWWRRALDKLAKQREAKPTLNPTGVLSLAGSGAFRLS